MQKGTVLSLKKFKPIYFLKQNNLLLILFVFLLAGLISGIFSEQRLTLLSEYSERITNEITDIRAKETFFSVFFSSFVSAVMWMILLFSAGTSMVGVVLVPAIVFLRCGLYGAVSAFLYAEYSVKGIAFNAVLIVPAAIIFIIALLLAGKEAIGFSMMIAKLTIPGSRLQNISLEFKNYCIRFLIYLLLCIFSAFTDAALSISFGDKLII